MKTIAKASISVALSIAVLTTGVFMFLITSHDPENQAFYGTKWLLFMNRFHNNNSALASHLTASHGAGPNMTKFILLASWTLREKKPFLDLLKDMTDEQRSDLIRRLAFTYKDCGVTSEFLEAYRDSQDAELAELKGLLQEDKK